MMSSKLNSVGSHACLQECCVVCPPYSSSVYNCVWTSSASYWT